MGVPVEQEQGRGGLGGPAKASAVKLSADDTSLLTGTSGMLAVMLTRAGAPRAWLRPFGLR